MSSCCYESPNPPAGHSMSAVLGRLMRASRSLFAHDDPTVTDVRTLSPHMKRDIGWRDPLPHMSNRPLDFW